MGGSVGADLSIPTISSASIRGDHSISVQESKLAATGDRSGLEGRAGGWAGLSFERGHCGHAGPIGLGEHVMPPIQAVACQAASQISEARPEQSGAAPQLNELQGVRSFGMHSHPRSVDWHPCCGVDKRPAAVARMGPGESNLPGSPALRGGPSQEICCIRVARIDCERPLERQASLLCPL